MKKRKIKARSVVYSGVGVLFGLIVTGLLLIQVPSVPDVSTTLDRFPGGVVKEEAQEEGEVIEIQTIYPGLQVNGYILGDNSYHVREKEIDNYLKAGTFRIGRWNPMLYRSKETLQLEALTDLLVEAENPTEENKED